MISIRPAKAQDGPNINALMIKILRSESIYNEEYHKKYPDLDLDNIVSAYAETNGAFLVAESKGKIIGTVGLFGIDRDFAQLRRFYVHQDFRRMGVGRLLLETVLELAKNKGFAAVVLTSEVKLKRALKLYLSAGFRIFKTTALSEYQVNYLVKFLDQKAEKRHSLTELAKKDWVFDFDGKCWRARP